jgi:hypothetical protein
MVRWQNKGDRFSVLTLQFFHFARAGIRRSPPGRVVRSSDGANREIRGGNERSRGRRGARRRRTARGDDCEGGEGSKPFPPANRKLSGRGPGSTRDGAVELDNQEWRTTPTAIARLSVSR